MLNLPSDWSLYKRHCYKCKTVYHSSDGGCPVCIQQQEDQYLQKITCFKHNAVWHPDCKSCLERKEFYEVHSK